MSTTDKIATPCARSWTLVGPDGIAFESERAGTLGGHRRSKTYGCLDCRAARQAIARDGYVSERVFFSDEPTARAAGYRPCAACMPERYAAWKARHDERRARRT